MLHASAGSRDRNNIMSQSTKGRLSATGPPQLHIPLWLPSPSPPFLGGPYEGNAPCPDSRWPQLADAPRRGLSNALLHGPGRRLGAENVAAQGGVSNPGTWPGPFNGLVAGPPRLRAPSLPRQSPLYQRGSRSRRPYRTLKSVARGKSSGQA